MYNYNPMITNLPTLKQQLKHNKKELKMLKARGDMSEDGTRIVERLKAQRDEYKREIARHEAEERDRKMDESVVTVILEDEPTMDSSYVRRKRSGKKRFE